MATDTMISGKKNFLVCVPGMILLVFRSSIFGFQLTPLGQVCLAMPLRAIGYLSRLLRLPSLAPDITTAIINGKNPPQLTAKKLMRLALQIPVDWTEQRKLLGFAKG